ncbi:MAG: tRNA (N6-threonylcarbamoyladenosine(37)-N6)-methyltransferase TrmO [Clostridiales bacterium]|nr:tRNA (N6-threonylcarbamoyladenosine(37)-N6)-methyltransferase TrmO [Clostridiales bacterium]
MESIAHIRSDFPTKFGVPRQAGLVEELRSAIVFEPRYRVPEALRGIEGFSHLWLIWEFSKNRREGWSPTVRPPRLGGNQRVGVFATRSPFRPNPIGLSCVKLEGVELSGPDGPVLVVSGADLVDGTPIFDIKPYLPYADCRPEAVGGFAGAAPEGALAVDIPPELMERVPESRRAALRAVLAQDPRPHYQDDPRRVYGFGFAGLEVRFTVADEVLTVVDIVRE